MHLDQHNTGYEGVSAHLATLTTTRRNLAMAAPLIIPEGAKAIPLTQGKFAIVDAEDYEWLMQWKWHFNPSGSAVRNLPTRPDGGRGTEYMHRIIMKVECGLDTDHANGNALDNRRNNLRICNPTQNGRNRKKGKNSQFKYKGISQPRRGGKYEAKITINGKLTYIGSFSTEEEAARAYNAAAVKYFGEFARLNLIS